MTDQESIGNIVVSDMMTSELCFRSSSQDDVYGQEYVRRLKLIKLNATRVIQPLYKGEKRILADKSNEEQRKAPWAERPFFEYIKGPQDLPQVNGLTLSELVMISDEATLAFSNQSEKFTEESRLAVWKAASQGQAMYSHEFVSRLRSLGLSHKQITAFGHNEAVLYSRLRWGFSGTQAWTQETTSLDQFLR